MEWESRSDLFFFFNPIKGIQFQDKSSKIKIIIYFALLVAAFALIVTAIIIYNQSVLNVYSQIDEGDNYTDLIFNGKGF